MRKPHLLPVPSIRRGDGNECHQFGVCHGPGDLADPPYVLGSVTLRTTKITGVDMHHRNGQSGRPEHLDSESQNEGGVFAFRKRRTRLSDSAAASRMMWIDSNSRRGCDSLSTWALRRGYEVTEPTANQKGDQPEGTLEPLPNEFQSSLSLIQLIETGHTACDNVFDPHTEPSRQVDTGLQRKGHPWFYRLVVPLDHVRVFMNLETDAMTSAVDEELAVPRFLDHFARRPINLQA